MIVKVPRGVAAVCYPRSGGAPHTQRQQGAATWLRPCRWVQTWLPFDCVGVDDILLWSVLCQATGLERGLRALVRPTGHKGCVLEPVAWHKANSDPSHPRVRSVLWVAAAIQGPHQGAAIPPIKRASIGLRAHHLPMRDCTIPATLRRRRRRRCR